MNRKKSNVAVIAALSVAVPVLAACEGIPEFPVTGTGAEQLAEVDGERLDAMVLDYLAAKDAPGATVAITKDSRLVWAKGYGYADNATKQLMQPDTRSRIGSVSKFFTAVGALQLVEDGRLDLDQHVYAPSAAPLWGSDPGATPGVVFATGGILEDPGAYFDAMVEGVDNLGEYFPPAEHLDEMPSLNWALLNQAAYERDISTVLERAGDVRLRNLLSHTAGMPKSGSGALEAAAEYFGVSEDDVEVNQSHQAFLMGLSAAGAPFLLDPGTEEKYSNQGFTVAGYIAGRASDEGDYRAFIENHVLAPLGLEHVVPNNADISELDAQPHGSNDLPHSADGESGLNPDNVSQLGLATGGWSATARDLTRVMCSIDQGSNILRSLNPATVDLMASDAAPWADGINPLGWDSASETQLTKNGDVTGGGARISKFLPGAFGGDAEINVAMAINKGDTVPSSNFLRDVAEVAVAADIPEDYDLFDPDYPCYVEPTLGLTVPSPIPHPNPELETDIAVPSTQTPTPTPTPTPDPTRTPDPAPESSVPDQTEPDSSDPGRTPPGPAVLDLRLEPFCSAPSRTQVWARVSAPAGVGAVQLDWSTDGHEGSAPMGLETDDVWTGTLEPIDRSTVPVDEAAEVIEVLVTITDDLGRTATGAALVECAPPADELDLTREHPSR